MAGSNNLVLLHDDKVDDTVIGRFDAIFPKSLKNVPKFIRLDNNGESIILKVRQQNIGDAIFVSRSVLSDIPDKTKIEFNTSTHFKFLVYKTKKDRLQCMTLIGLVLAFLGTCIDGSFTIGKSGIVLFTVSLKTTNIFLWASMIFKLVGLVIIYLKGILESK